MNRPNDDLIFDFWTQLDRAGSADPGALEPSLAETIGQLHDLSMAPVPDSTRERIRRKVLLPTVPIEGEELVNLDAAALPLPNVNGRSSPVARPHPPVSIHRPATISTRWRWISIAAALLILLTGLSGWFIYERVGDNTPESPAVIPAIQATPTGDWPMYRGNPARTGSTTGHGIIGQPQIAWTFQADGSAFRSPAVVAGIAYLGSADGNLYALDATTGAEQWRFGGDSAMESMPTVADGTVYIPSDNGTFYAIDAETGELLWQFEQAIIQNYSAIAFDTTIVVGNDNAEVIGLDTTTGEPRWSITLGGPIDRTPGADGSTFFASSADGKLYALNATDGSTLWTFDTGDPNVGTPSIVDGMVYLTHHGGKIVSVLDAGTGEEQSHFDAPSPEVGMTPPAITDDGLYAGSGDKHFYRLDRETGAVVWSFPLEAESYAGPVVADGIMYGSGNDGVLHALDAATGNELWNVPLDGVMGLGPSLAGGMLYVSTDTGTLYAIAGMGAAAAASTPEVQATPAESGGVTHIWTLTGAAEPFGNVPLSAIDPQGRLWVADPNSNQIQIFDLDGTWLESWGEPGSGEGQFNFVRDNGQGIGNIAFDADGNIYVSEGGNRRVQKFDKDRKFLTSWGGNGTGEGQFLSPFSLNIAPDGKIFVGDDYRLDIQVFDADGNFLSKVDDPWAADHFAFIFGPDGELYFPQGDNTIQVFDEQGKLLRTFVPADSGVLNDPAGFALDAAGNIYVANIGSREIVVFDPDGKLLLRWGSFGSGDGQFNEPAQLLVRGGFVYVIEATGSRIQKFQVTLPEA